MSNVNTSRYVLQAVANEVNPTGFTLPADAATILRKVSTLFGACAQGAFASNLSLSYNPVAAQATVNTTNGSETANDTLTVANTAITLKASGATGNQANIAAGTKGTSTGGNSAATTATGLAVFVNINGDGPQIIYIDDAGTHTGAQIASKIQTAIRAVTPINTLNAVAYSAATCSFTSTHYLITSGAAGKGSSVVITPVPGNAGTANLKLGIADGGTEAIGTATTLDNIATLINGATSAWAGICSAFVCGANLTLTATLPGTIGNGLALSVSSTGSVMTISHAWGSLVVGTEGTQQTYSLGL